MASHLVFLYGDSPWTEEPGGLQSMGYKELDTTERLSTAQVEDRAIVLKVLHVTEFKQTLSLSLR